MTEHALAQPERGAQALERVLIEGDLATLSPEMRIEYYNRVCESMSLNPLTKPFDYLRLNNRLVLYAKRDATDQLRKLHGVSITKLERERLDDVYCVTAYAATADGRTDSSLGAVPVSGLKGEALANAYMKAETKSKRRVTLSICGLGMLDELEVSTIPGAQPEPTIVETRSLPATIDAPSPPVVEPPAPAGAPPAPPPPRLTSAESVAFREPTEDEWTVFYDLVKEATGYSVAEVHTVLGRTAADHLRALHAAGRAKTGSALKADLIAYKREGRAIPGVVSAAVEHLQGDLAGSRT